MAMSDGRSPDYVLVLVRNIPHNHHSKDLRNYFSQFIESGGFLCFHFRHRPETNRNGNSESRVLSSKTEKPKRTLCCVVKVVKERVDEFFAMYMGKHWIDSNGDSMPSLCFLAKIKTTGGSSSSDSVNRLSSYLTREEEKQRKKSRPTEEITQEDLDSLIELNPPDVMPRGNVGTPTKIFLDMIQACKLPSVIIKKLGLTFPKTRSNRFYGSVPFEYDSSPKLSEPLDPQTVTNANGQILLPGTTDNELDDGDPENAQPEQITDGQTCEESKVAKTIEVHEIHKESSLPSTSQKPKRKRKRPKVDLSLDDGIKAEPKQDSESDSDDCEDWERHEVLHDDSANAERNKQRLYEEEMEVVWEKGGSGLVFYTDANHWKAQEGDFDEQTADDWDVDMEIYTDPTGGDKDARDFMEMRQEKRRRKGIIDVELDPRHIGKFEKHTKGFGRKLMEKQGWTDGKGLGSWRMGMAEALHNDGQAPGVRDGLGYTGEKLQRYGLKRNQPKDGPGHISTKFDNKKERDPIEPLLRRQGTHHLKHRPNVNPNRT